MLSTHGVAVMVAAVAASARAAAVLRAFSAPATSRRWCGSRRAASITVLLFLPRLMPGLDGFPFGAIMLDRARHLGGTALAHRGQVAAADPPEPVPDGAAAVQKE